MAAASADVAAAAAVLIVAAADVAAGMPRPHNGPAEMTLALALMSENVKITWQADGNKRRQCIANDEMHSHAAEPMPRRVKVPQFILKAIDGRLHKSKVPFCRFQHYRGVAEEPRRH